MAPSSYLLIGLLVVLVLLVVYAAAKDDTPWSHRSYWRAKFAGEKKNETAGTAENYNIARRSDGTFDRAARTALNRALATPNPTPLDHLLAATVITHNIIGQEHRPETRGGQPTPVAMQRARERRGMYDTARTQFMAAVDGARRPAAAPRIPQPTMQQRGRATVRAMQGGVDTAGFTAQLHRERLAVLNAATEFAFGGMGLLFANDPLLQMLVAEDWAVGGGGPFEGFVGGFAGGIIDAPLAERTTALREELVAERQAAAETVAAANGGARGAAVAAYVNLATQNTNDPQNVHDSGVLACLKAIVQRLREEQGPLERLPDADRIAADVRANGDAFSRFDAGSPPRPALVEDVLAVIAKTKAGERVVALGATDEECLRRVWARADDPRNAPARGKMRQAVFDALLDAWEPEFGGGRHIACVNGRTGRLLGALNMLDYDKRNWEVKRLEQFKNEIFAKTRDTIEHVAAEASVSGDPDTQKAGRLYLAKNAADIAAVGTVPDAAADALADRMRQAISDMIDGYIASMARDYGVEDAIPPYMVEAVKTEAMAAV